MFPIDASRQPAHDPMNQGQQLSAMTSSLPIQAIAQKTLPQIPSPQEEIVFGPRDYTQVKDKVWIGSCYVSLECYQAVVANNVGLIRSYFTKESFDAGASIDSAAHGDLLCIAAERSHLETALLFLNAGYIQWDQYARAIKILLKKEGLNDRDQAIIEALISKIIINSHTFITYFVDSSIPSDKECETILTIALNKGFHSLVEAFDQNFLMSHRVRDAIIAVALRCANQKLVEELSANRENSEVCEQTKTLMSAVSFALENGNTDAVESLFKGEKPIKYGIATCAIKLCDGIGIMPINILRILVNTKCLTELERDRIIFKLCSNPIPFYVDIITGLKSLYPMSKILVEKCLLALAPHGYVDAMRVLLGSEQSISDVKRNEAIGLAVNFGQLDALQFLVQGHHLQKEQKDNLILKATSEGHVGVLEFLLDLGPIDPSIKTTAKVNAQKDRGFASYPKRAILKLLDNK